MTQVTEASDKIRNGVDTEQLFGTLDAVKAQPELATFQFRVGTAGSAARTTGRTIKDFYAAGGEDSSREEPFVLDAGEPPILIGTHKGPNPAEYLLHALAACLTTSLVYVAAARGVHLTEVESTLEGDMDVQGALGLSDDVPQRLRADPRVLPREGRRAAGEAPGSRRPRPAPLRRLRHGHQRRAGVRGGRDGLTRHAQAAGRALAVRLGRPEGAHAMQFELTAKTEPGARLVALAETLAEDFASRARVHDREASYPFEDVRALRSAGYFAAPIPEEHGGLGVTSTHDVVVASSRLARGDASVAIGVNMHLAAVLNMVRRWQMAVAAGNERAPRAFARSMERVARDGVVMAAAISEPSQDITRPSTLALRTESGWRINGRKIFCTMSPAASVLYTAVTFLGDDGGERYGYALIPTDAPGVTVHDDWDAMGMRASGSNSVTLTDVELPAAALRGGFPVGDPVPYMERNLAAGLLPRVLVTRDRGVGARVATAADREAGSGGRWAHADARRRERDGAVRLPGRPGPGGDAHRRPFRRQSGL